MNETTSFFASWGFWLCLGLVIGAIVGFFTAALCAISGQASRDEERWEEESRKELIPSQTEKLIKKYEDIFKITKEKPDRK